MADTISATFLIPQLTAAPLQIEFRHEALQMVVVDRDQWNTAVGGNWQSPGVYLLFGPADDDEAGRYSVYVGRSSAGTIANRIGNHVKHKEGWDRALLVKRTAAAGLNSTDVGWLEGRLHEILSSSSFADVTNRNKPGDDTIADWDREALERVVTLIQSVMRVIGFRTDSMTTASFETAETSAASQTTRFDADLFHRVAALVQPGEWTTYGDIAQAIGSHPRGLGAHIRSCSDKAPEWRILNKRGESQPGFTWTTRDFKGSQLDVLTDEGVAVIDEIRADPRARVDAAKLQQRLLAAD